MAHDLFLTIIERTLDELPAALRDQIENVEIIVEHEHWDEPDLYGLYEGIPLTERMTGSTDLQLPDRIYLFRAPLVADFARADAPAGELAREIRVTLLHEIAHYFGIDEDRLNELGWA